MTPFVTDPDFTLYVGDALEVLHTLPDESVHCCVTSPPYWSLRDYQVEGQLGLEASPDEYVAAIVNVFREVRRVLRADGTLWLNLGDSYVSQGGPQVPQTKQHKGSGLHGANRHPDTWTEAEYDEYDRAHQDLLDNPPSAAEIDRSKRLPRGSGRWGGGNASVPSLKAKDLVGIPWRVAFALQADGWYLRSDIVWSKPNPMPESVTDRPTKAHEYVFLLTRSPRYFFDQEAVREAFSEVSLRDPRLLNDGAKRTRNSGGRTDGYTVASGTVGNPDAGRNLRSVWEITTQPYPEAHFATFPEALPERCIRAGTSERGCCPECGAPWVRTVELGPHRQHSNRWGDKSAQQFGGTQGRYDYSPTLGRERDRVTIGWRPSCVCETVVESTAYGGSPSYLAPLPCTVLDPFMGSGTTALVARKLGRRSIGIELSPEYAQLAARRLQQLSLLAEPA